MLPSVNPYASPQSESTDSSRTGRSDGDNLKRLYFGWLTVFALNVIVPLLIGLGVTTSGGRIGMLLAMLVLLALGFWICARAREVGFALVVGGVAVALSQVFPILQVMAGIFGFALAESIGLSGPRGGDLETLAAGFAVTLATGGLLAAASLAAGLGIRAALHLRRT